MKSGNLETFNGGPNLAPFINLFLLEISELHTKFVQNKNIQQTCILLILQKKNNIVKQNSDNELQLKEITKKLQPCVVDTFTLSCAINLKFAEVRGQSHSTRRLFNGAVHV